MNLLAISNRFFSVISRPSWHFSLQTRRFLQFAKEPSAAVSILSSPASGGSRVCTAASPETRNRSAAKWQRGRSQLLKVSTNSNSTCEWNFNSAFAPESLLRGMTAPRCRARQNQTATPRLVQSERDAANWNEISLNSQSPGKICCKIDRRPTKLQPSFFFSSWKQKAKRNEAHPVLEILSERRDFRTQS